MEYNEEEFLNADYAIKKHNQELLDIIANCTDENAKKQLIYYRNDLFDRQQKVKKYYELSRQLKELSCNDDFEKEFVINKMQEFINHLINSNHGYIMYAEIPDSPMFEKEFYSETITVSFAKYPIGG